jgi:hypothetical protein
MVTPFDPQRITAHVSMNRVRLVDLPGLITPDEVKNKTAYELASSAVLVGLIRAHADQLQLSADFSVDQLPIAYANCLTSVNPKIKAVALEIAGQFGRNIGYLLATLKRGDDINRAARAEWDSTYWDYWKEIHTVWLGGGLVSGNLGKEIRQQAVKTVTDAGILDLNILVSRYGLALPLVGAARHAPCDCESALIFDFGSTFIKRAYAQYDANTLVKLQQVSSIPSQWTTQDVVLELHTQELFDYVVKIMVETWESIDFTGQTVLVSIACYLSDGHPQENQGGPYAQMRSLTHNLQAAISEAVSQQVGRPVHLRLIHDGTAAAATYAGSTNTAVLMMGTALGIGFPPVNSDHLLSLGDHLKEDIS